jgi:membrane protein YqaA with SNARE-associated domain
LHTIKHILSVYGKWIWGVLAPLGPWGVFAIAAVDAALLGMPMDAIVAGYIYKDPPKMLLYVVLASAGSALGSILVYVIGHAGGEVLLRKRLSPERFEKIHASFERHEFWALMFPAMLPPPTPFKAVALSAAAFEMRFRDFMIAIFAGRFVRFLVLGVLTLKFGPGFVAWIVDVFAHHFKWVALAAVAALAIWLFWIRRKKASQRLAENENAATIRLRSEQN